VNSRFGRLGEQHELRETITGSGKMNKLIASRARTPSLRLRPPSPRLGRRIRSHHEIAAWLVVGEQRGHELVREALRLLRTIAAAPATAAA
jgi:hypothetical protein